MTDSKRLQYPPLYWRLYSVWYRHMRVYTRNILSNAFPPFVEPFIFLPNAFSPNNDSKNDNLCVRGNIITSLHLVIYDRWGGKVFESRNISTCWDGTHNGKKLDAGVYVYKFEASMVDQTTVEQSGTITLFR